MTTENKEPVLFGDETEKTDDANTVKESAKKKSKARQFMEEALKDDGDQSAEDLEKEKATDDGETSKDDKETDTKLNEAEIADHVDALFAGAEFSDEFKEKVTTVLEYAVKTQVEAETLRLKAEYDEKLAVQIEALDSKYEQAINDYLSEGVKTWISENKIAISRNLMLEQAQSLLEGLRGLLIEHNINVPEGQENLVEAQAAKIDVLRSRLNEQIETNTNTVKKLNEAKKEIALNKLVEGLSIIDAEKVKTLAESVDANLDVDGFTSKVKILKESYVSKTTTSETTEVPLLNESTLPGATTETKETPTNPYVSRTLKLFEHRNSK